MAFWVTLLRGFFAVGLGVALFINPDKARPLLANFMGFYWLGSGVIALRWSASGNRSGRLVVIAGIIGVLAGLATISRHLTRTFVDESLIVTMLGVVIILTGLLHFFVGFRSQDEERSRKWTSSLLGIFEIVLGVALAFNPQERGPIVYLAGTIWAFLGGLVLMLDALRIRRQRIETH